MGADGASLSNWPRAARLHLSGNAHKQKWRSHSRGTAILEMNQQPTPGRRR